MTERKIENNFTTGPILVPLLKFAFPVLLALILQGMYGAVDLLIVGKFGSAADVVLQRLVRPYYRFYCALDICCM